MRNTSSIIITRTNIDLSYAEGIKYTSRLAFLLSNCSLVQSSVLRTTLLSNFVLFFLMFDRHYFHHGLCFERIVLNQRLWKMLKFEENWSWKLFLVFTTLLTKYPSRRELFSWAQLLVVVWNYEMLTHFVYLFLVKRSEDDAHKWVSKIHRTKNRIHLPLLHPEVYEKNILKTLWKHELRLK